MAALEVSSFGVRLFLMRIGDGMSSWRDSASPQAQADLDELLNASLGFARQQLADHGEFYPFAAAIRTAGQTEMIAGQARTSAAHPTAAEIIASCLTQLASSQHAMRAAAIIADVRLPDHGGEAIEVSLEHAEGQALRVLLPYARQRIAVTCGPIRASAGNRRIWSQS
jgi:hypothetical protein